MTQNEILAMLHKVIAENQQFTTWTVSTPHLVALVNQAVEQEREQLLYLCELPQYSHQFVHTFKNVIRSRGKE